MNTGRAVIGTSVVSAEGEKLGVVDDVLIDTERGCAAGLVVRSGLLHREGVLSYADVRAMGPDAVLARGGLIAPEDWKQRGIQTRRITELRHRHVLTRDGQHIGRLADVCFDNEGVVTYEVEQARLGGIVRRHRRVQPRDAAVGEDAIVVANAAEVDEAAAPEHSNPGADGGGR